MPIRPGPANPFDSESLHLVPYGFDQTNWDSLLARLESLHYRAAVVGAEGSGKTTLPDEQAGRYRAASRELYAKHLGNIRDVLRELYDRAADGNVESR